MIQQFINRERELGFLEKLYAEGRPHFLVLYGRRRVGKTDLALRFAGKKPSIYFLAEKSTDAVNMKNMSDLLADFLKDDVFRKAEFESWTDMFEQFSKRVPGRFVLTIDEFPFLIESNKAIPSVFQKIWDLFLSKTPVFLILIGSSISMMETEVLGGKSPLYGRRTAQWKLLPFGYAEVKKFFPGYTGEQLMETYAVLDGIPHYLRQFDKAVPPSQNIREQIFTKGRMLNEEAEVLLKEEMREPRFYFSILHAIASGSSRFGEIANATGLEKTLVSKYLDTLHHLHIIEKVFPVTVKNPKSRDTLYEISDNYFRFYFRFIHPNKGVLEKTSLLPGFEKDFKQYLGKAFEKVCMQFLSSLNERGGLPFRFKRMGRWWEKGREIDILCIGEDKVLLCEVKWSSLNKRDLMRVWDGLREKGEGIGKNKEKYFCIIAKKAEKISLDNTLIFDVKDIYGA